MKLNEKGFTLTETLLVFSVFLLISSFPLFFLNPHAAWPEKQLFFSQFKSDLFFAQQYAISHQTVVRVNIMSEKNYYYFRENFNGAIIIEKQYSKEVKVTPGTMPLYFDITANGNLNQFGALFIRIDGATYRMVFLIGRGRFYVVKE